MSSRVVISGMGLLSSAGPDLEAARPRLVNGTCCLSPLKPAATVHLKARYAGLLSTPGGADWAPAPDLIFFDRHISMAATAAREALQNAHLRPADFGRRMGLIFGTCSGPMLLIEDHYRRIVQGVPQLTRAQLFAKRYYSGALALAHLLEVRGFSTTILTACSASTAAIALAADLIACGFLDCALAGGADAFSLSTLAGFDGLKATCEGRCAPFSKPAGLNLGEAAGFVLLETKVQAERRGAAIRAEILGSGMSNDAYHCSSPQPGGQGLATAIERALRQACVSPAEINFINAHGTGTEANDKAECRALRKIFGDQLQHLPVSSTKSLVGHCLGAAGVIETVASILCAEAGVLPSTANFTEPRDGCGIDCVPTPGRTWSSPRTFLCNNSAFGGHNSSLAISVPERPGTSAADPGLRERIYITGCGVLSPAGLGISALVDALARGRSALQSVAFPHVPHLLAGLLESKAVAAIDRRLDLRDMDRCSQWATVASRLAIRESGLLEKPSVLGDLGLFLSLGAGPSWAESEYLTSFFSNHSLVTQVSAFPYIVPGSVMGNVCRSLGLRGHTLTLSVGPGAGLLGLPAAVAALRCGHADALLTGAVDELTERILTDGFLAGPFSEPEATVPGEGAVVLMLETERHLQARGARALAEVCGLACATEAVELQRLAEEHAQLPEVVRDALQQASLVPADIDKLCFQGPHAALQNLATAVQLAWATHCPTTAHVTGCLEAAQGLLDLTVALKGAGANEPVLAVVASPHGLQSAVVLRRVETDS